MLQTYLPRHQRWLQHHAIADGTLISPLVEASTNPSTLWETFCHMMDAIQPDISARLDSCESMQNVTIACGGGIMQPPPNC
ncbi:hypothetical protein GGR51DRAFT_428160 [Nemania sp. FL0031]|nr:hypothetical protein GGR51DRAFT_428160 [Nemania sp. FL0031]